MAEVLSVTHKPYETSDSEVDRKPGDLHPRLGRLTRLHTWLGKDEPEQVRCEWINRGEPKGPGEQWLVERMVQPKYRKRRARETVEITYCPAGWWSESGGFITDADALCSAFFAVVEEKTETGRRISHAFDEAHRHGRCGVVWRVRYWGRAHGRYTTTERYCDASFPAEYRELTKGLL